MPFDAKGAKDSGGGVKGIVTKKIGPLPVWAYVVGGAAAVFLFTRGRGGSSTSPAGSGIRIPVFTPGSSSDGGIGSGGNAVGSPAQNVRGGSDTQPGGTPPATVPGGGDKNWFPEMDPRTGTWRPGFEPRDVGNPGSGKNPGGATAGNGPPQYGPGPNGAPFIPAWQFPGGTYPPGIGQWGPTAATPVTTTAPTSSPTPTFSAPAPAPQSAFSPGPTFRTDMPNPQDTGMRYADNTPGPEWHEPRD